MSIRASIRSRVRRLLEKNRAAQFVYLTVQGFVDNRCPARAAGLAYTTLLALVPLLAVVFAFSKSLLKESSVKVAPVVLDKLLEYIAPGQVEVAAAARQETIEKIQSFIGNIEAGALGTIGTLALLLVAIRLLMTIEQAFNDIWGIAQGRSVWRRVVYYWTALTLGPVLLIGAVAVTGTTEFAGLTGRLRALPGAEKFLLKLLPFVLLWGGFTFLYAAMPNTAVRFRAALMGGIVGGSLWQINNLLNAMYVSRVVTYSKIYGGLGIIPVFLVGLYCAWLIVLFGAQVSCAAQNARACFQQRAGNQLDQLARERLACQVVLAACQRFLNSQPAPTTEELAATLAAAPQLLNRLVHRLAEGGILVAAGGLVPARPPENITLADVLHVLRTGPVPGAAGADADRVGQLLAALQAAERAAPANLNFREILQSSRGSTD